MGADFDADDFLPYLLNQAGEATGRAFERHYRDRYGMLRAEWRVLYHLGRHGRMSAGEIAARSMTDKTKVSRAVARLEAAGLLRAAPDEADRRRAWLSLTPAGTARFSDLSTRAAAFDAALAARLGRADAAELRRLLRRLLERAPPAQ
jgi:DNA-binding MarR family transcriptional regulator